MYLVLRRTKVLSSAAYCLWLAGGDEELYSVSCGIPLTVVLASTD